MTKPSFLLRGFKPPRDIARPTLGSLEMEVMNVLWREGSASVRDVLGSFGNPVAYTTIMTTLDRLYRKGLLDRRKVSRAFIYSPRFTLEEFNRTVATDVISGLLGADAEPILACIVDAVSERDRQLLDQLDKLVEQKKRELAGTEEP